MPESGPPYHVLFSDQGAVIVLPLDKHVFFGRAEGNTIAIDDTRVSRQHSEMWWDGSVFIISDLNSSNGTRVNEQDIAFQPLKNGDVIGIGSRKYTYRVYSDKEALRADVRDARKRNSLQETRQMHAVQNTIPDTDFNGTLASIPLTDLCQLLALCHRTGMLHVQGVNGRGEMFFRKGEVIAASVGKLTGDAALIALLHEDKGFFSFKENAAPMAANVAGDLMFYLLEVARERDERARQGGEQPSADGNPTVRVPR